MFDSTFDRSRAYFKTLEMLRIFGSTIRETGRDLQEMDPERLLQGSFRRAGWDARYFLREDPNKDTVLWENWRVLSEFQKKSEERLLRRIIEKTEEIKSLRDGVGCRFDHKQWSHKLIPFPAQLFNATSLREAARSTTMNRYIIVFTIVTVLYLPPSLTTVPHFLFFYTKHLTDVVCSLCSARPYSKPMNKLIRSSGSRYQLLSSVP